MSGDAGQTGGSPSGGFLNRLRGHAAAALKFWEPMRLVYNLALFLVVLLEFFLAFPGSKEALTFNLLLGLFFLAVLANIAYCAAYIPDLFVQFAGLQPIWKWGRLLLLAIGIVFAAVITHFFAGEMFRTGPG